MDRCIIEEKEKSIEILEFNLNNDDSIEKYAVEILYVYEVYAIKSIAVLPCTPPFIIGITNFRGKVISVIDIRNFLGFTIKKRNIDSIKNIIVIHIDELEFGIVADSIIGCSEVLLSEIQKNILGITNSKTNYIKGINKHRSIIIDMKNIIMDERIIVDEEIN